MRILSWAQCLTMAGLATVWSASPADRLLADDVVSIWLTDPKPKYIQRAPVTGLRGECYADVAAAGSSEIYLLIERQCDHFYWDGQGNWVPEERKLDTHFDDPLSWWTPFFVDILIASMINAQVDGLLSWHSNDINYPAWENLSDGMYKYRYRIERANHFGEESTSILYDFTPPQAQFTNQKPEKVYATWPTVVGDATDPATDNECSLRGRSGLDFMDYSFQRCLAEPSARNSEQGQVRFGGSTYESWTLPRPYRMPLLSGWYEVGWFLRDRANHYTECTDWLVFGIDTGSPQSVSFNFPAVNATIAGFTFFSGLAADDNEGMGIDHVDVRIRRYAGGVYWDGVTRTWTEEPHALATEKQSTGVDVSSWGKHLRPRPAAFSWLCRSNLPAASELENGAYTVQALAYDQAGHSITGALPLTLTLTQPNVFFSIPSNGAVFAEGLGPFCGYSVLGAGLSITQALLRVYRHPTPATTRYWNGTAWTDTPSDITGTVNPSIYQTWRYDGAMPSTADEFPDGLYYLSSTVRDNGGNEGTTVIEVRGDSTAPDAPMVIWPSNNAVVAEIEGIQGWAIDTANGSGIGRVTMALRYPADGAWRYWNGVGSWLYSYTSFDCGIDGTNWAYGGGLPAGNKLLQTNYEVIVGCADRAGYPSGTRQTAFSVIYTAPDLSSMNISTYSAHVTFPMPGGTVTPPFGSNTLRDIFYSIRRSSDGWYWNGSAWESNYFRAQGAFQGDDARRAPAAVPNQVQWIGQITLPQDADAQVGDYVVDAEATDVAGNTARSNTEFSLILANPQPVLDSLEPSHVPAGSQYARLVLHGSNFITDSLVLWDENVRTGDYVNANEMIVYIGSNMLAYAGAMHGVSVRNPEPGGGDSFPQFFEVDPAVLPAVNDLFADRIPFPAATMHWTNTGNNIGATVEGGEPVPLFQRLPAHSVWWCWGCTNNGLVTISTMGSDFDTLLAAYTGTDISNLTLIAANDDYVGGSSQVSFYPDLGYSVQICVDGYMGATGCVELSINQELGTNAPVLTRLEPPYVVAGAGAGINVHARGTHFDATTTVLWDGADEKISSTYRVDGRDVYAHLYNEHMLVPTQAMVSVYNLDEYGGRQYSGELPFYVLAENPPAPILRSLAPNRVRPDASSFVLTLAGENFINGCQLLWNGTGYDPETWSATQLTWTVDYSLFRWQELSIAVAVSNPPPAGGQSDALPLVFQTPASVLLFQDVQFDADRRKAMRMSGPSGMWEVQRSTNLTDWTSISTNDGSFGFADIIDTAPQPAGVQFYRGVQPDF